MRVFSGAREGRVITVLIADDQAYVRDIYRFLIESAGDIEIVATASNGREAVEQAALCSPHIVVMDISMPGMDGIEATRQIRAKDPTSRILMISMHREAIYIEKSVQAGALGYVLKDMANNELVSAIRSLHQDHRYFSQKIAKTAEPFLSEPEKTGPIPGVDNLSPT